MSKQGLAWTKVNEFINKKAGMFLQDLPDRVCMDCLLYTSPSPRDGLLSRMPSSA